MGVQTEVTPPIAASAMAGAWLARLHGLQTLREQFADAPDFQRWVIQARVLQFLIDTHAADPDDHPLPSVAREPWVNLFAGAGKVPRGAEEIRPVLQGIAARNEEIKRQREMEESREVSRRRMEYARAKSAAEHMLLLTECVREETAAREAAAQTEEEALECLGRLYHRDDDLPEIQAVVALETASASDTIASEEPHTIWPELPTGFVGLCIAGPLGNNTMDSVVRILASHLKCGGGAAYIYAGRLRNGERFTIDTDRKTALSLAAKLRGIGLQSQAAD